MRLTSSSSNAILIFRSLEVKVIAHLGITSRWNTLSDTMRSDSLNVIRWPEGIVSSSANCIRRPNPADSSNIPIMCSAIHKAHLRH